jgi:putative ABC transport system permease protein
LQQEDRGFRPENVLTLRVPVGTLTQPRPEGKYDTRPRQIAYYREVLDRVKALPGIRAAAIVNNLPLSGVSTSLSFAFAGRAGEAEPTSTRTVSPEYFAAMGIPLIAGRTFNDGDTARAPGVAIVNEYMARQLFPNRDAIGQKLLEGGTTIIGIVKDSPQINYEAKPGAEVYIPYQQFMFATFMSTIVVRTDRDPSAMAAAIKKQVWSVDPAQPVVKVQTMEDVIANSIWRPRFSAWIFSVLSLLSVFLTAIGVYAVVAYTSTLRVREIGIRAALGATPENLLAVILRRAMMPLLMGLGVGVAAALLLSRLLTNLVYGVSSSDPLTYVGAAALVLVIGAIASARPAWQAATRDSLPTLRAE